MRNSALRLAEGGMDVSLGCARDGCTCALRRNGVEGVAAVGAACMTTKLGSHQAMPFTG
jgi:hypothetical protein